VLRFRLSAFAHGVTDNQMQEVLANQWGMTKWFEIHDSDDGDSQDMVVGFDADGALIEIGITYVADDEIAFHADKATSYWIERYNKR